MLLNRLRRVAVWIPACLLAACATPPTRQGIIAEFGVTDVEVRSVKVLGAAEFNDAVREAAQRGEAWARNAIPVALRFAGEELRGSEKIIEVRTPPGERRDAAVVTITESGWLDDSVAGERYRLWMVQEAESGTWIIERALWALRCRRPGRDYYSAEPAP